MTSYDIEIHKFVKLCRENKVTYLDTAAQVKKKFKINLDKWSVWNLSKSSLKKCDEENFSIEQDIEPPLFETIEDLIIDMKKKKIPYTKISDSIRTFFPEENREIRNLIYRIWKKYTKNSLKKSYESVEKSVTSLSNVRTQKTLLSKRVKKTNTIKNNFCKTDKIFIFTNPLKPEKTINKAPKSFCCECNGAIITDTVRGEISCRECGLVINIRNIDQGPEWRCFDSSDHSKIRVGGPASMAVFDTGLSTDFNPFGIDGRGVQLTANHKANYKRLRKWQTRSKISDSNARNLSRAFNELDKMCSQLRLSRTFKEDAAVIYRQLRGTDLTVGCSINGLITACIYAVCRIRKRPITQDEILACSPVKNAKELRNCFNRVRELDIGISFDINSDEEKISKNVKAIPVPTAKDYIDRYASDLDIPQNMLTATRKLVEVLNKSGISVGKNPHGVAAAALYIIGKIRGVGKTQKDFSIVSQVTEVTIRQRTKEIVQGFKLYERYPDHFPPKQFK